MARKSIIDRLVKRLASEKVQKNVIEGRLLRRSREGFFKWLNKKLLKFEEKIDFAIGKMVRNVLLKKVPIQENMVAFCSFQGDYTDNPKYIAEELIRRHAGCELVWIGRKEATMQLDQFPEEISQVYEWWTWDAFVALAKAKVLVVNSVELFKRPYPKKKGQYIIETWHGSLGIKRFDKAVNTGKAWVKAAELTTKIVDFMVSNSTYETNIYRTTFWPKQEIWEVGHPRNDCIINCTEEQKAVIRARLFEFSGRKDHGEKLFLYAPTFRDAKNFDCYNLHPEKLAKALSQRFGGEWIGLYRYHPTVRKLAERRSSKWTNIMDLTNYPDMQDLLQVADIGITDYSSWIYDYMLTDRPAFIFAKDIELYNTERGFAYPLQATPFPIAVNNKEMVDNIKNFDAEKYENERQEFLKGKGCIEDGHASERVADHILELLEVR